MKSKCCNANLTVFTGSEGTNHWICDKCGKPSDPADNSSDKTEPDWEKRFDEEFGNVYSSKAGAKIDEKLRVSARCTIQAKAFLATELERAMAEGEKRERERIAEILTTKIKISSMLPGWERFWKKAPNGRYVEDCMECENSRKIFEAIQKGNHAE